MLWPDCMACLMFTAVPFYSIIVSKEVNMVLNAHRNHEAY